MRLWTILVSAAAAAGFAAAATTVTPQQQQPQPLNNARNNSQVRLAYYGEHGMMVSWNTAKHVDRPAVHWGRSAHNLDRISYSNVSVTYPTSTTYNNHVLIDGLEPSTTYYYLPLPLSEKESNPDPNFIIRPYTFTTSRRAGQFDGKPLSVAVVADLGTMGWDGLTTTAGKGVNPNNVLKPGQKNTIESLTKKLASYEFLWHIGDIAYADYWLKEQIQGFLPNTTISEGYKLYEMILNDFHDQMMPITSSKPYMVGPGNHDANCNNGGATDKAKNITYDSSICSIGQTNFTGYKNHFRMPGPVSGGTDNFWFSFDSGLVHFVQLDTETDLGHGYPGAVGKGGSQRIDADAVNATMDAQLTWLQADLAAVDRVKTPWIIVAGHRPLYLSKNETGTICFECLELFEPILVQHQVDLYFAGHCHVYERLSPISNGKADPKGLNNPSSPWYITNGAAGHYDGLDTLPKKRLPFSQFSLDQNDAVYGWSKLTFHNCTHLTHEFIASNNDTILDTATLFKDRKCASSPVQGSSTAIPTPKPSVVTAAATTTMTWTFGVTTACLLAVIIQLA